MATLQYTVFSSANEVAHGDPVQEGAITIGGASTQGSALSSDGDSRKRMRVRIAVDSNCWVTWGTNPTALNDGTEGRMMVADQTEYFDIEAGHKIAVITRT